LVISNVTDLRMKLISGFLASFRKPYQGHFKNNVFIAKET